MPSCKSRQDILRCLVPCRWQGCLCVHAHGGREISVLSAPCPIGQRNHHCSLSSHCFDSGESWGMNMKTQTDREGKECLLICFDHFLFSFQINMYCVLNIVPSLTPLLFSCPLFCLLVLLPNFTFNFMSYTFLKNIFAALCLSCIVCLPSTI